MPNISIGVIGTGGMGTRHTNNLHRLVKGARVAAVYDLDRTRANQVAKTCGDAVVFEDAHQLIRSSSVDAVVIASPDATHAALARACVQHGKRVLCEKPLGTTAAEARSVVDAELASGKRLLSLGFMRRFDPQHVGVKHAIDSGTLGRPLLFKGSSREISIPNGVPDAERLSNSASHDIDAMRWLLGREPRSVFVQGIASREGLGAGNTDLLVIQFGFEGAALGTIEHFPNAGYGYDIQAEVVCERGVASTASPSTAQVHLNQQRGLHVSADWLERFQTAYVTEFQAWVDALNGGPAFPGACAWDGYCAARLAEACLESITSGRAVMVESEDKPKLYG
jgi:myo-inositol 2-dehydrogenase/D-chiro-inositol 1-dehydrogenase